MKHSLFTLLFLCAIPCTALAQQRIPDLSLPPDESLRQPNISHQGNQPIMGQNGYDSSDTAARGSTAAPQPSFGTHFIDGYCDPNFRPLIANTPGLAAMQECLDEQKQQACETFRGLPADAKRAISDAIDCRYQISEGAVSGAAPGTADCSPGDTARLQLLEKYWNDSITAQALVFLPDTVLGISGRCTEKLR